MREWLPLSLNCLFCKMGMIKQTHVCGGIIQLNEGKYISIYFLAQSRLQEVLGIFFPPDYSNNLVRQQNLSLLKKVKMLLNFFSSQTHRF